MEYVYPDGIGGIRRIYERVASSERVSAVAGISGRFLEPIDVGLIESSKINDEGRI